jgi:mannan polymerase II complex MNN10 subunit
VLPRSIGSCLAFAYSLYHPAGTQNTPMSLSRSPSPIPGGGWSSPGLDLPSGRSSPAKMHFSSSNPGTVTWESARMKSQGVTGYPSFSTQNQGFFTRNMRRISSSLPSFSIHEEMGSAEKEKRRRAPWKIPLLGRAQLFVSRLSRVWKIRALLVMIIIACYILFYTTRKSWS